MFRLSEETTKRIQSIMVKYINKYFIIAFVVGAMLLLAFFATTGNMSLEAYADNVIEKCKNATKKQECYDQEIPKLMGRISMEDAFRVTTIVQEKDTSFPYCHVLGHILANIETKKNPEAWKNVIGRCPSGVCSNGCVHGAFQEKYRSEILSGEELEEAKKELEIMCEGREGYRPTNVEQGSCYHALGHLLIYVTGADINKAVSICDETSEKPDGRDFRPLCYDGAFMQIFQPVGAEDITLIQGKEQTKESVVDFCANYSGEKRVSCWTESWPLFIEEIMLPGGALNFCSRLSGEGKETCLADIFYIYPIQVDFNQSSIKKYCSALPGIYKNKCIGQFATRLIEIDSRNVNMAVSFCEGLDAEEKTKCLEVLADAAGFVFHPDSPEYDELCRLLPTELQSRCYGQKD